MPKGRAYGIPDIELASGQGGTVNPSNFAGHDLVMLFCPTDRQAAERELADYNALADALAYNDAYMIAICDREAGMPASRISIAADPEQRAWGAFSGCVSRHERPRLGEGAVLLFGRGGCLRQIWEGVGHAKEVVQALGERM